MRPLLFLSLLLVTVFVSMMLLPAHRPELPVPAGEEPPTPAASRCYTITYVDVPHPERLPHQLTLLPDTLPWILRRRTYRAVADRNARWRDVYWAHAGSDSVDVTGHHKAILRMPITDSLNIGRGEPYLDGPMLLELLFPTQSAFRFKSHEIPCSGG